MHYNTNITVRVKNHGNITENEFKNEFLSITRGTDLFIKNLSETESEFVEQVLLWHTMDKNTNKYSTYIMETSELTPIQKRKEYYLKRFNKENQTLTFEESY
ncbi:hypothetical protein [Oceanobacillus sp. CFH 90083]|uniref:hypothetical protein n=1 Tax=Oceanobacillus sp. CFH 90083 TaxID=2592336 RepID=UPI00128B8455|nr:hypothetical protein [Oceanobacillus sp. CFH 90083]